MYHQQLCALQSCVAHIQVELHHAAARGLGMPHLICAILFLYSGYESGETPFFAHHGVFLPV